MSATEQKPDSRRPPRRKSAESAEKSWIKLKTKTKLKEKQVLQILKKSIAQRTRSEDKFLKENDAIVKEMDRRVHRRNLAKQKTLEREDSLEEVILKAEQLAKAMKSAKHCIVYTGAGISTAASIPDYRGPNGVWTLLQKGQIIKPLTSLTDADPTLTHMSLAKLCQENIVQHVVSQNCDGLHQRSGIPWQQLSELHGNMYIEVCPQCESRHEYIRLFDVTEKTSFRRHKTGRLCAKCSSPLQDTIVHFGEKGKLEWPLNWQGAIDAAANADVILCIGSSLKVLKRYRCLWAKNGQAYPQLYIVNLQWTPKDFKATLKINAKCDDVMKIVMDRLGLDIPQYNRIADPIFKVATALRPKEFNSFTTKLLEIKKDEIVEIDKVDTPGWFGKGCSRKNIIKKRRRIKTSIKSEIL